MKPIHFMVILTFWSPILKLRFLLWKCCPGHWLETINGNCILIFRAWESNTGPMLCRDMLTFWHLSLKLWSVTLKSFANYCSMQLRGVQWQRYIWKKSGLPWSFGIYSYKSGVLYNKTCFVVYMAHTCLHNHDNIQIVFNDDIYVYLEINL